MFRHFLFLISVLVISACTGNRTGDCRFGSPNAIFSAELPGVTSHQFEAKGQIATEHLHFDNGLSVELHQSGCNEVRQEFRFYYNNTVTDQNDSYWKEQSIDLLRFLGSLSSQQNALLLWAQEIETQSDILQFGQSVEIQPLIFVKLDRIISEHEVMLLIELSQESPK